MQSDHRLLCVHAKIRRKEQVTTRHAPQVTHYHFDPTRQDEFRDRFWKAWDSQADTPPTEAAARLIKTLQDTVKWVFEVRHSRQPTTFPRNHWWNGELHRLWRKWRKARDAGSPEARDLQRHFRRKNRALRRSHQRKVNRQLADDARHHPERAYRIFHTKTAPAILQDNEVWTRHIRELYETNDEQMPDLDWETELEFTEQEIAEAIRRLPRRRAADTFGMTAEILQMVGAERLAKVLRPIFMTALRTGFPSVWTRNRLVPIYKSGDPLLPSNYRTICISNVFAKLFARMVERRLVSWAEMQGKRAYSQAGFRPKRSCTDHVLTFRVTWEKVRATGGALFCTFVDFSKAFDRVNRRLLADRLRALEVPEELVAAITVLYAQVQVEFQGHDPLRCNVGVRQGCPLSPTLFGLYIDAIESLMREQAPSRIQLAGLYLFLLIYADDVLLLARTQREMQKQLDALALFSRQAKMVVNLEKTLFGQPRTRQCEYQGTPLVETDNYRYLGYVIHQRMPWKAGAEDRRTAAWKAYYSLRSACRQNQVDQWGLLKTFYETKVITVALYLAPGWGPGLPDKTWKGFEELNNNLVRQEFRVAAQTPKAVAVLESGLLPLEMLALQQTVNFVHKLRWNPTSELAWQAIQDSKEQANSRAKGWWRELDAWTARWKMNLDQLLEVPEGEDPLPTRKALEHWLALQPHVKLHNYSLALNSRQILGARVYRDVPAWVRRTLAVFRMSSNRLMEEFGRHLRPKLPRQHRRCLFCLQGVEDLGHVLFSCPRYEDLRRILPAGVDNTHGLEDIFDTNPERLAAIALYLALAMRLRNDWCSIHPALAELRHEAFEIVAQRWFGLNV